MHDFISILLYYSATYDGSRRALSFQAGLFLIGLPIAFAVIVTIAFLMQRNEIKLLKIFRYLLPVPDEYKQILFSNFDFYASLNRKNQDRFAYRVHHFLINKNFVPDHSNVEIDLEKKVLVAAAVVQIGFGLSPIYLAHFKNVIVHESGHHSLLEISKKKSIIISWKEFEDGYANASDGYNPGLQSIAVAINIEHSLWGGAYGVLGRTPYRLWKEKSRKTAATLIRSGFSKFSSLRDVNENEYFAASVVYFFEQPEVFYTKFPELYKAMKLLLKQDPRKNLHRRS